MWTNTLTRSDAQSHRVKSCYTHTCAWEHTRRTWTHPHLHSSTPHSSQRHTASNHIVWDKRVITTPFSLSPSLTLSLSISCSISINLFLYLYRSLSLSLSISFSFSFSIDHSPNLFRISAICVCSEVPLLSLPQMPADPGLARPFIFAQGDRGNQATGNTGCHTWACPQHRGPLRQTCPSRFQAHSFGR